MSFATALFCVVLAQTSAPAKMNDVPEVLRKAYSKRTGFQTAYFQYKITEQLRGRTEVQNTEAWFVGDGVYRIEKGDDDGIRAIDPGTGVPAFGIQNTCLPDHVIFDRQNNRVWQHTGSADFMVLDGVAPWLLYSDARAFGLFARAIQRASPQEMLDVLLYGEMPHKYRVTKNADGTQSVVCTYESSKKDLPACEYVWTIDPAKDFAITHVTDTWMYADGRRELVSEANSEYMLVDGRWWPSRTESLCPLTGEFCSVEWTHAEFDKPHHPKKLIPELMGVPVGTAIHGPQFVGGNYGRYAGDGVALTESEWAKVENQYDLAPLHAWRDAQRRLGNGQYPAWWDAPEGNLGVENLAYRPDAWEAYVRRWITKRTATQFYAMKHPLDEKQVIAAWAILKDCRSRAEPIRRRVDRQLEEVEHTLRASDPQKVAQRLVSDQGAPKEEVSAIVERRLAAEKRRTELEKPKELEAVFQQLKGRLQRLLTTAQSPEPVRPKLVPPPGPYRPTYRESGRPFPLPAPPPARPRH